MTDSITDMPLTKQYHVPEAQRADYGRILEQAHRHAQEVEPKLPMYFHVLKNPDMIRKLIAIVRILDLVALLVVLYSPFIFRFSQRVNSATSFPTALKDLFCRCTHLQILSHKYTRPTRSSNLPSRGSYLQPPAPHLRKGSLHLRNGHNLPNRVFRPSNFPSLLSQARQRIPSLHNLQVLRHQVTDQSI